jgi:hypothetical protein
MACILKTIQFNWPNYILFILPGFEDHVYPPQEQPPSYNQGPPQYSWHGQSYAPTDQPGFSPAPIEGQQANYRVVCVHVVQSNMY